nr:DUF6157 family protein [Kineosporia babensis]
MSSFISVAEDSKATEASVPPARGTGRTVAQIQYELLRDEPYAHTQEDVLFASWFERQGMENVSGAEMAQLRAEFFAKDQPCLRTSPLARTYGWGLVFDEKGGVALCAMESPEYQELLHSDLKQIKAMRSKRA